MTQTQINGVEGKYADHSTATVALGIMLVLVTYWSIQTLGNFDKSGHTPNAHSPVDTPSVWPDWAIFLHFGQLFQAFGNN